MSSLSIKKNLLPLCVTLTLLAAGGCKQKSRFAIDTGQYPQVTFQRLDRDMLSLDTARMVSGVRTLYHAYPDFFPAYVANVLGMDAADTAQVADAIRAFLTDSTFAPVNRDVLQHYASVDDLEKTLTTAYAYLHHYFPDIALPKPCLFVSGFNLSILMTDSVTGMGTDMYLGTDYPAYANLTYRYMAANMNRANLVPDMVSALLFRTFRMDSDRGRLIDHMLYRGKVMYLLSVCLPDVPHEVLIGYTPEQLGWCRQYERAMWAAVIDQKHLFSSDVFLIRKYVNDAPFTAPLSQDAPGRAGTWLGWQIVRSYMEQNPAVTLPELMRTNDYDLLLEQSGYRP